MFRPGDKVRYEGPATLIIRIAEQESDVINEVVLAGYNGIPFVFGDLDENERGVAAYLTRDDLPEDVEMEYAIAAENINRIERRT